MLHALQRSRARRPSARTSAGLFPSFTGESAVTANGCYWAMEAARQRSPRFLPVRRHTLPEYLRRYCIPGAINFQEECEEGSLIFLIINISMAPCFIQWDAEAFGERGGRCRAGGVCSVVYGCEGIPHGCFSHRPIAAHTLPRPPSIAIQSRKNAGNNASVQTTLQAPMPIKPAAASRPK